MATTSIWHVKGDLKRVVDYVANADKTANPDFGGTGPDGDRALDTVTAYAADPSKTEQRLFVTGVNCDPKSACADMNAVKRGFSNEGGIVAWHGYQSFKPGETTPEVAHEIGVELARRMWGDRFQVVVATHLDRGHLHNHMVLNSVSFVDGSRWYRKAEQYRQLRETSDALCREYRLSVIDNPKPGKSKHHAEWQAERDHKPTWRSVIRDDIDECIARARNERQFFENLTALGYEYKVGKDISVRPPGKERFFRLERNFGDGYSIEGIRAQIRAYSHRHQILPMPKRRSSGFKPPKKLPAFARGSIVALHRHYLYLLGYYQLCGEGGSNARIHWLLREEIRKLDDFIDDTRLLGREDIHSLAQLNGFRSRCEGEMVTLTDERKELKAEIRAAADGSNRYTTKDNPEYQQINQRLKRLRKEVAQCTRIEERQRTLGQRIDRIELDEQLRLQPGNDRKEEQKDGRDRAGHRPDDAHHAHGR
ncbi:MAG: relaxase/mobilization nuclease domain-containing protein [Coriobacteriales bacterium]|jgi:hypothetical protein|nr:relaxase/mobilization nuclease domain-containing protein [Coriobacteriales bacterium]